MVDWLWLPKLLILASVIQLSFSIQFFPDSEFGGRAVTADEAEAFFRKIEAHVHKRTLREQLATKYSDIANATIGKDEVESYSFRRTSIPSPADRARCFTRRGRHDYVINDTVRDCDFSVNSFLHIYGRPTLQVLSGDILNGNDYVVKEFTTTARDSLSQLTAKDPGSSLELPGVHLNANSITLTLVMTPARKKASKKLRRIRRRASRRRGGNSGGRGSNSGGRGSNSGGGGSNSGGSSSNSGGSSSNSGGRGSNSGGSGSNSGGSAPLTMKQVEITIEGKGKIKLAQYSIGTDRGMDITITKSREQEAYGIAYHFDREIVQVLTDINTHLDTLKNIATYLPTQINDFVGDIGTILSDVSRTITSFTLYGAFDKDETYQIGVEKDATTISGFKMEKMNLIISLEKDQQLADAAFILLAQFGEDTNLFKLLGDYLGGPNFFVTMLKQVQSPTWCVLLLTKPVTFIDVVKTRVITECLGDALKNTTTPDKVEKGAHFYIEVQLKPILDQCWSNAPTNVPARFTNIITKIPVYASLTADGIKLDLPGGSQDAIKFMQSCTAGLVLGAPKMLTESQIEITEFKYKKSPLLVKFGLKMKPFPNNTNIPGTRIGMEELIATVTRSVSRGGVVVWNIDGSIVAKLSDATIIASIRKRRSKYNVKVEIDAITLGDIFESVSSTGTVPTILKEVGIEEFKMEYDFSDQVGFQLKVSGRPLIVGYSNLHISAQITKSNAGAITFRIGLYLNGADFDGLMKRVAGNSAVSLKWLNNLKAVVVFSSSTGTLVEKEVASKRRGLNSQTNLTAVITRRTTKENQIVRQTRTPGGNSGEMTTVAETLEFQDLHTEFQGMTYVAGLTFGVAWTLPTDEADCFNNGLCIWMVRYIGNQATLMISGSITRTSFTLAAALKLDAILHRDNDSYLSFRGIELILEVGVQMPRCMIRAKLEYMNRHIGAVGSNILTFTGSIEATPISIQMTFSMEGFVFPTVLSRYFAIGNVILGVGISFTTGLPTFVFGATVLIGVLDSSATNVMEANAHAIRISGYFGVNPGNPRDNWIHGSISGLTIRKVHEAFRLDSSNVPDVLRDTGFPSGITVSFALREVTGIPSIGTIPPGLTIIGSLNFFGLECHCKLAKDLHNSWNILIEMSPINWGNGWIQILKSSADEDVDKGPKVDAVFGANENSVEINGYINALSVLKAEVRVSINNVRTFFSVRGYIIPNLVVATVEFLADYSGSGDSGLFQFKAIISTTEFTEKLKNKIKEYIKSIYDAAIQVVTIAENGLLLARRKVQDARDVIDGWRSSINEWKNRLQQQKNVLEEKSHATPPCYPPCEPVCLPFLDWSSQCWKFWGHWIGCPYWNNCFIRITDPFCLAGCALSRIVSTVTRWAQQAILSITMLVAEGAKGLLKLAEGVLDTANGILKFAEDSLAWMKDRMRKLLLLANNVLDRIFERFSLRHLELTAGLSADYTPCVGYAIYLVLNGADYNNTGEVCLDFKGFLMTFVRYITDRTSPQLAGVSEESKNIKDAKGKNRASGNSLKELKKEEDKADAKITNEENKNFQRGSLTAAKRNDIPSLHKLNPYLHKLPKRTTIPDEEEAKLIKLANEDIPRYNAKYDPHVRSIIEENPWSLPDRTLPVGFNATVHDDSTVKEKRQLDFGEDLSPCERMKRALNGYSGLTDGLITYSKAIQGSNSAMEDSSKTVIGKLRNYRSEIEAAEMKHNMSSTVSEEAYFVHRKLSAEHEDMVKKSKIAIKREDSYALPIIRRQINNLLKKEKGSNFLQFTELMHVNAVQGYKRSLIPHPSDGAGETLLANIKQDLQSIVTNEESDLTPMEPRLNTVKKNIISMSAYTKSCQAA